VIDIKLKAAELKKMKLLATTKATKHEVVLSPPSLKKHHETKSATP